MFRINIVYLSRGSRKFLDAPKPISGRVSIPPLGQIRFLFAYFAFFRVSSLLPFGCGSAALGALQLNLLSSRLPIAQRPVDGLAVALKPLLLIDASNQLLGGLDQALPLL